MDRAIITYNGIEYPAKTGIIDVSSAGFNEIIAAVPNKRIYIDGYTLVADDTVHVAWYSGSDPITGPMKCVEASGSGTDHGLLTDFGEALRLHLSDAVHVGGHFIYTDEIP